MLTKQLKKNKLMRPPLPPYTLYNGRNYATTSNAHLFLIVACCKQCNYLVYKAESASST